MKEKKQQQSGMEKIATFIVDKRNLFFLLYIFALIFSVVAIGWVKVENDITAYLPADTETRQGLTVMNDNFTTFGSARVMVSNITYETAEELCDQIKAVNGVDTVEFDDTEDHYKNASALYTVSFDGTETDPVSIDARNEIASLLSGYDSYIDSEVGKDMSAELASEMGVILAIAAAIIVVVLTLTSRSYAEVPVLILTFGAAALLNMGTNFLYFQLGHRHSPVGSGHRLCHHSLPPVQRRARNQGHAGSLHRGTVQSHPRNQFLLPHHHFRPGGAGVHAFRHWP